MDEFKKELKTVNPFKIDVGAIYNVKPKDHKSFKSGSFAAVEREVVFDIDMTDYDEVRCVWVNLTTYYLTSIVVLLVVLLEGGGVTVCTLQYSSMCLFNFAVLSINS